MYQSLTPFSDLVDLADMAPFGAEKHVFGGLVGVWTKCQPDKMPTGQNANLGWHFVRDFCLWLAFCPDQLFGWHFVRTISACLRTPPNIREWGGPVTSFCLLLTVVGEK